MGETAIGTVTLRAQLDEVSGALAEIEAQADALRALRNELFVGAYDQRLLSVTEMARISGLRRESVHEAINRTKGGL